MRVRRVLPLGIVAMLCACGPPASDAGRTGGKEKSVDSAPAPKKAAPAPPQARVSTHRGLYRRLGKDSHFRPCGAPAPLVVIGTGLGLAQLAEQFRWNSVWAGQNLFGVFEGLIRTDTQYTKIARTDSVTSEIRTRFVIFQVESLRSWQPGDCNGMRVP